MHALNVLEFGLIRSRLAGFCQTPLGQMWAENLTPTFKAEEVWTALDETREAYDALGRFSLPTLGALRDPREMVRLAAKGATLSGQDLYRTGESLSVMRSLKGFLEARKADLPKLSRLAESLPTPPKLEEILLGSMESDGTVRDSASPAIREIRVKKKSLQQRIQDRIQSYISGKSRDLLSDPIFTVRDGRYVLPLKAENRGKIRGIVHDSSASGQTIYVEPEDVVQLGNSLREAEASEREEALRLYGQWSRLVGAVAQEISAGVLAASTADLWLAKGRLGYEMKACLPEPSPKPYYIRVEGGRHPLLDGASVIPIDIAVGRGENVLITGPNTGGKTVAIKCVGLFVLMAQSGLMLPARAAFLSPFSQIWADIGDEQSLQQSLSTFSGHLKNVAEALQKLKLGALVLLDEIGSGTDPAEGAALARAILEALVEGAPPFWQVRTTVS